MDAVGATGKLRGQDGLSLGSAFPFICACGHRFLQGRGHVGPGSISQEGLSRNAGCHLVPPPATAQRSGGLRLSGDVAMVKPQPVPGAVQQGQSLPSNWTTCQTMGVHLAGAGGKSEGQGVCPPLEQGQWIAGVPEQAEG